MTLTCKPRSFIFSAILLLVLVFNGFAQGGTGTKNRIKGPVVESDVVTLSGNTHPLARPENDLGAIPYETRMERMMLLLQPDASRQNELDALTEAQQEPESAQYRQWLTPEEFGSRFGASFPDLARIAGWLEAHGFTVEPVPAGRSLILFSGTAGQVEETFHAQIHSYAVNGQMHLANSEDPQIPRSLSTVVAGIVSLHDFRRVSAARSVKEVGRDEVRREGTRPDNTQGSTHYLFPADYATIYDLNPLYVAGKNGNGVSIAIVGRSNITLSDVSSFRSYSGLTANQPTVILDGANPGLVPGDHDESTLDVEWSGAVAPGAAVKFVVAASTATSDGVDLSAQYIVNHKTAPVMSTSYGNCELYMGATETAFYNSLWQQAAAEGISSFVSSGDSGAAGCNGGSSSRASMAGVNGLCSSPYSTCVGGTEFNEGSKGGAYWGSANGAGGGSALSYIPEKAWNESASGGGSGLWASGGGISIAYAQPVWQKGIPGANSNGMRAVPDVALTAAGHDGYLICENGNWYVIAGTSAASPSFAGIMAVVVQKAGTAGASGIGQGNANPTLYGLLNANVNPFHATASGNNSVPGVNGFTASGAAYNLATGLGSVDANLLVNQWPVSSGGIQQGFTLKPSVSSESILAGKSATLTVSVSGTGGFTGSVNLAANAPSGVTVTFNPSSVKVGASATGSVVVSAAAQPGTSRLIVAGTGLGVSSTASVTLTVQAPPTLIVSTAATAVSVVQGKSATLPVTVSTGGSFAGTVTLSVTGLPTGVTVSWSNGALSANGVSSAKSTLTLKAATTAALGSTTFKMTASGDGVLSQTVCTLQVNAAPAVKAALSPASIAMKSTASQHVVVTLSLMGGVRPASNLSGVSFQSAGLPNGISASWGKPSLTATGALQATLTLAGSTTASSTNSKPTITGVVTDAATGIKYTASQQASLEVTRAN